MKFIPKKVTIRSIGDGWYGYFYGEECFAFVWAFLPFSKAWWNNLLFMAQRSKQDCLKLGEDIKRLRQNT